MFLSIFTDELGLDLDEALPIIKSWGLEYCDLRGRVLGKHFEGLEPAELTQVAGMIHGQGLKVGCLQSSLAKVHLPGEERQRAERGKLDAILRTADALDCRRVRAFHFWQPPRQDQGHLAVHPDKLQIALDMLAPLVEVARSEGLELAFENCGVTPAEVFAVLDDLDEPSFGLAWDVANDWGSDARRKHEDEYLRKLAVRAKMVHVKAVGAAPSATDGDLIPYDKVLSACDDAGMDGPVSAETHNPMPDQVERTEMSKEVVDTLKRAWPSAAPGGSERSEGRSSPVTRDWEDDPVGFVVVGLGMGHGRSRMISETPGTRLIGVCDVDEERARRTSDACEVPYKLDFRQWLDHPEVEAVFVLTETGRHAEVGLEVLRAGKHLLTTKPMDVSLDACDGLVKEADERGLTVAVDFDRRSTRDATELRRAVAAGAFGRLLSGSVTLKILRTMEYFNERGGWRGTIRWDGGGVLSNQSVHEIDGLVWTLGAPTRVRAAIWTQTHDIEAEDLGMATWEYDSGLVVSFQATSSYPQKTWYVHQELEGTDMAYFRGEGGPFRDKPGHLPPSVLWCRDGEWSDVPPERVEPEWLNSVDNFAAHLRAGAPLLCPGWDGRRTQSVLHAMYESARHRDGAWVRVPPTDTRGDATKP
ncbi:MAG: TIM barrel protein [Armatimonadia bacterium]|nr:TIM barrel protein [Armatimonadia bacterium]